VLDGCLSDGVDKLCFGGKLSYSNLNVSAIVTCRTEVSPSYFAERQSKPLKSTFLFIFLLSLISAVPKLKSGYPVLEHKIELKTNPIMVFIDSHIFCSFEALWKSSRFIQPLSIYSTAGVHWMREVLRRKMSYAHWSMHILHLTLPVLHFRVLTTSDTLSSARESSNFLRAGIQY
jgi:hypothetical protein